MSTFINGQICYFKKSKKTFWRTLVQGGGEVNLKAYRFVQGGGGPKSGKSERTYFMDALICQCCLVEQSFPLIVLIVSGS